MHGAYILWGRQIKYKQINTYNVRPALITNIKKNKAGEEIKASGRDGF